MSRRESCVWHPMPDEVRRSSVQSRRASLAAGRRKSMNTNEPDWEVEAPATPPHQDYTPRDEVVAAAVVPVVVVPAAAGSDEAPAVVAAGPVAVVAAPQEEHSPVEREAAETDAAAAAAAPAAVAASEEREAIASIKSAEPTEMSEDEGALQAVGQADAEAAGKGRTRHIVRFHGERWPKVLRTQRAAIEAAFLEDIHEAAGVEAEEAKRLKIKMHDCMEVTFVVHSDSRARQKKIHAALQQWKFPKTTHVYTAFQA